MRGRLVAWGLWATVACAPSRPPAPLLRSSEGAVEYSFGSIDGELISASRFRGRTTLLLFGASYDLVTQAVSRRLGQLWHEHTPRINVALVLLEPPQNVEMARAYRDMLSLDFPIGLGDSHPERAGGPFAPIRVIPFWVVLGPDGSVQEKAVGDLSLVELHELVAKGPR